MGFMDQIGNLFGRGDQGLQAHQAQQVLDRFNRGQTELHDPASQDYQHWNQMVQNAPPEQLNDAFAHAAQNVDPQEYYNHVTPGVGGTNPLGSVGQGGLSTIASTLLGSLSNSGGGMLGNLINIVPGLRTTNPQQMDANQVASLSNWMRQNHPQAFGQAATQIGRQQPGLLHSFLGKGAMMIAAAALASKFLGKHQQ